ncbi:MAG: prolyl oligopeptidase family serine peptidase [Pseudomonadota bacterium]
MRSLLSILIVVAPIALCAAPKADDLDREPLPLEAYAHWSPLRTLVVSPSGTHLATKRWVEGVRTVVVQPLDDPSAAVVMPRPRAAEQLIDFTWANDDRLLITYRVRLQKVIYYHQYSFARDGQDRIRIAPFCEHKRPLETLACHRNEGAGELLDLLPDDPAHVLISGFMNTAEAHVWKTNVYTGESTMVQDKLRGITTWRVDQEHQVRLGYGTTLDSDGEMNTKARHLDDADAWVDRSQARWVRERWWPIALDDPPQTAFGAVWPRPEDTWSILRFDLQDGQSVETVASSPRQDLAGILVDNRLVGYGAAGEWGVRQAFIDPQWATLQRKALDAFPGKAVAIDPVSANHRFVHMRLDARTESSVHLLWDRPTGQAVMLGREHPSVAAQRVLPSRVLEATEGLEVIYTAPPGRPSDPPPPAVIIPRGGPGALASDGFDYLVQAIASRGYAVLEVNLRGPSFAGRRFIDTVAGSWRRTMHDDLTDALRYAIDQGLVDRARTCAVGVGAAAYVALMDAIEQPDRYACLATINGIADLAIERQEESYDLATQRYIESRMGFKAAELSVMSPRNRAEELVPPLLLVHAEDDRIIDVEHARHMRKALRKRGDVTVLELARGGHTVESTPDRLALLQSLESFLGEHLGTAAR